MIRTVVFNEEIVGRMFDGRATCTALITLLSEYFKYVYGRGHPYIPTKAIIEHEVTRLARDFLNNECPYLKGEYSVVIMRESPDSHVLDLRVEAVESTSDRGLSVLQ